MNPNPTHVPLPMMSQTSLLVLCAIYQKSICIVLGPIQARYMQYDY